MSYVQTFFANLRRFGGSGKTEDYTVRRGNNPTIWINLLEIYPHYKDLQIHRLAPTDDNKQRCICKHVISEIRLIQKKGDMHAPLIQVGNCCVKKFLKKDPTTNCFTTCATCNAPFRHSKYGYVECRPCRERRSIQRLPDLS